MVMAGVVVVTIVGCQLHTAPHDQMQPSPTGHQRPSSAHTTFDLTCVVAAMPIEVSLTPLSLVMPYAIDLVWHSTAFAFPPFIPPEDARRA